MIGEDFPTVLAAAQRGSEDAFSALYRDATPDLLRYLRVAAPGAAEDVVAETWVQICRGLPGFGGDERAWRCWLFTVARRRALDESHRQSRYLVARLGDLPSAQEPRTADAQALALQSAATAALVKAVLALPSLQAEVILLRMLAGLDNEAVAQIVGRSPGAVRVAAHQGLRRLAQTLSPVGVTP